jgi:hypothetical protein
MKKGPLKIIPKPGVKYFKISIKNDAKMMPKYSAKIMLKNGSKIY